MSNELLKGSIGACRMVALEPFFTVESGVLVRLNPKNNYCKQVVVPTYLRHLMMEQNHGGLMVGHFSGNRSYNTLVWKWWWSGMNKDPANHCKSCAQCALIKNPLQLIHVQRIFQIIGVDVMNLPPTEKDNKHVIVFQDLLSKWPFGFPHPRSEGS